MARPPTNEVLSTGPRWAWAIAALVALAGVIAAYQLAHRAPRTTGDSEPPKPAAVGAKRARGLG